MWKAQRTYFQPVKTTIQKFVQNTVKCCENFDGTYMLKIHSFNTPTTILKRRLVSAAGTGPQLLLDLKVNRGKGEEQHLSDYLQMSTLAADLGLTHFQPVNENS